MSSNLTPFSRPVPREAKRPEPAGSHAPLALVQRPRRNRKAEWSRRLVRENLVSVDDLIWPLFLMDGTARREPVPSMPGVERLTVDEAVREAERAAALRVPAPPPFPHTPPPLRAAPGAQAPNPPHPPSPAGGARKAGG